MGDKVYGPRKRGKNVNYNNYLIESIARQMLHAWRIGLTHPVTEKRVSFEAPIPSDMQAVMTALRQIS